jgi:succinyl-CoA synthetase beta subunit
VELHEYQVKSLLSRAGVVCAEYIIVDASSDLPSVVDRLGPGEKVVRPQVHGSAREERVPLKGLEERLGALLGESAKILVMEPTTAEKKYSLTVTINRSGEVELRASQQGKKIYSEHLFLGTFHPFQINRLVSSVGLKDRQAALFKKMIEGVLQTFFRYDAYVVDLRSIALTEEGRFEVVDAQIFCDDRALYRQPELRQMDDRPFTDILPRPPPCILIDSRGSIACIGNGAALALATADVLQIQKGTSGRVIDVGSECVAEHIITGMKMVGSAKAAIIHLFTGLLDGEILAKRLQKERPQIPMVVLLEGTNATGGRRVLKESRSPLVAAESLLDALQAVVKMGGV